MNYEKYLVIKRALEGIIISLRYTTPKRFINLFKICYSYILYSDRVSGLPFLIRVEPTNLCDLDCTVCLRRVTNYGYGYLDINKFKEIINFFSPYSFFVFLHYWGEPTLHKNIGEMIKYVKGKKMCAYLSTNFNNVSEHNIKAFVDNKLDYLTVSLDGATQATYSKFRKKGDIKKVISNIKRLLLYRKKTGSKYPKVIIQFIAMKHNQHEINDIKKLAKDLEADVLHIKTLGIKPLFLKNTENFIPTYLKAQRRVYTKKKKRKRRCFWLYGTANITWNAKIMPCCVRVYDAEFGNFSPSDFEKIWKYGKINRLRQNIREGKNIDKSNCLHCDFLHGHGFLT